MTVTVTVADDAALLNVLRDDLYTAVVSDILDGLGRRDQAMDARVRPVYPDAVVTGFAHTVLSADVYTMPADRYSTEIAAIDSLKPNDVLVGATNDSQRTCFWGELLSTAARARGARGAVIDGHTRDVRRIVEMEFPLFSTGMRPVDSAGRGLVISYGDPVVCAGVLVNPGDVVFGDVDGVVVIPRALLATVIEQSLAKVHGENESREMLRQGAMLRDVYDKFGVL